MMKKFIKPTGSLMFQNQFISIIRTGGEKLSKIFHFKYPAGIILYFIVSFIGVILLNELCSDYVRAEKYRNATGEIVEMPKGMKPPPKQTWDSTPYQLPAKPGQKATPVKQPAKSPATVNKTAAPPVVRKPVENRQPQTVRQPRPTPQVPKTSENRQVRPSHAPVSKQNVQRQHPSPWFNPWRSQSVRNSESRPHPVSRKPASTQISRSTAKKKESVTDKKTPSVTATKAGAAVTSETVRSTPLETSASGKSSSSEAGTVPDSTLPIAVGVTAAAAALGALGSALSQGIPSREVISEFVGLLKGEFDSAEPPFGDEGTDVRNNHVPPSGEEASETHEEGAFEEEKRKKAYADLIRERSQCEYTSADQSQSLMDQARDEVQQRYELEKTSTWSALDQVAIEDFIAGQAPSKEAGEAMLRIVEAYTGGNLDDGAVVVNRKALLNDLSNYLADANRLDRSQFTADEIDSAFQDALDDVRKIDQTLNQRVSGVKDVNGSINDNIELLKKLKDTDAYTKNPKAKKALEFILSKTAYIDKLNDKGMTVVGDAAKWSGHVVEFGEYYKAYQRTGLSNDQALERALVRKSIDIAVDEGVDALQNKCPVLEAANYFYDYGVKAVTGEDYGMKKSLNCLGQRVANWAHGDYQTNVPELQLKPDAIKEANIEQMEKLAKVSSGSQKQQIDGMIKRMRESVKS